MFWWNHSYTLNFKITPNVPHKAPLPFKEFFQISGKAYYAIGLTP